MVRRGGGIGTLGGNAGLISIYVIFLFLEQRSFNPKIKAITASNIHENEVAKIIEEIDKDTRTCIGVKTFTSLTTGFISWGIMATAGLDFATFWGMLIFFFNYIPTIGSILATAFPSVLALIQFDSPLPIIIVTAASQPPDDDRSFPSLACSEVTEFESPCYPPIPRPLGPRGGFRGCSFAYRLP